MNTVLVNRLFAGKYLDEGGNIGHEVINLFKADDGAHYLYITNNGIVDTKRNGSPVDYDSVVFVQHLKGFMTYEIIAVAKELELMPDGQAENVRYLGVSLPDVFRNNTYRGRTDNYWNVTFRAGELLVPEGNGRLLITIDKRYYEDNKDEYDVVFLETTRTRLIGQNPRLYCSEIEYPEVYKELKKLIEDESRWRPIGENAELVKDVEAPIQKPTFLEIICKQNDELVFSNLLAHYFALERAVFSDFAKECLGIDNPPLKDDLTVNREFKDRIDLWIEDDNYIIIIENKLGSGINGIDDNDKSYSQLKKYYEVAEKYRKEEAPAKKCVYYLFTPNYNDPDLSKYCCYIDENGNETSCAEVYQKVTYEQIYNFFSTYAQGDKFDGYFPDFLRELKRHTAKTEAQLRFDTMRERFVHAIRNAKIGATK